MNEKLYAIKNDEGEWLSFDDTQTGIWYSNNPTLFKDKSYAEAQSMGRRAHVVTLIEEPEKVVLTKEQAEIVEEAHVKRFPATFIYGSDEEDEELLMKAYVNGYTVAKEKKYLLPMDGTLEENDDNDNFQLYAYCYKGRWLADEVETDTSYKHHTVTQKELETAPDWVKTITPVEVTDDGTK